LDQPITMHFKPWSLNGHLIQSSESLAQLEEEVFLNAPEDLKFLIEQLYKLSNGETPSLPILTSGSTGSPKEIHFSIDELAASADLSITALKLNPKSRLLLCLPLSGVGGLMILVRTMRIGAELITVKPSSMIHPSMFDNQTINWTSMTPHQLANSEESFNFIENVLIGGAALSENTLSGLTLKPKRIVESYGMTETLSHIALRERYPMSERFFKTLDTIKISKAENGALLIDTPYLKTKKHLTNDEVELVDECHFDMIGRLDDVINTGGVKIYPRTVEEILKSNHWDKEFFVCGTPHPSLGSQITIVINAEKDIETSFVQELIETIDWPEFHKPRKVILRDFIYTATGKINKRATL
jgi:O-succinylbenzoic acid--CoA ligase